MKLGDFGISKILSATCPEANTVLGTPYYISPEIVSYIVLCMRVRKRRTLSLRLPEVRAPLNL